ncbi:ABC transporter ATP-binding protein [Gramella sp. AN32]|uniref:ABC transporter ATP-binding protein n=1 Tax=Christiangramia antarctica TaxID=2058158 RepID=A0ABW5XC55_9FLAO|nr:ABC transporter ATP-binding protein [Gramella sp. AN32]MCM4156507.1 ABC transporter ATP-binding protein [Gramella sp. AN32]
MRKTEQHIILRTENLSIGYKHKKEITVIARDINLKLPEGNLIAVIGVNGSGKTTLIKTLTNNLQKIEGKVFIKNIDLDELDNLSTSKMISLVLTNQLISKNLTAFELIALGRQPYTNWLGTLTKEDLYKINEALELVEISALRDRKCHEISDGQFQKVLIARALAQDTPLLILDEPTNHLDLYHKVSILKLLKKLCVETHKTILFASHELNLALQLCDQLIIIKDKKLISGSPEELINGNELTSLFNDDLVYFNESSKSFQIKQ